MAIEKPTITVLSSWVICIALVPVEVGTDKLLVVHSVASVQLTVDVSVYLLPHPFCISCW